MSKVTALVPRELGWTWPRGEALRYCVKVTLASLFGYVLSIGGVQYAVYGAFTGALIVGASRGEDLGSAANRARGSFAGMLVGIAASDLSPHPGIAVAVGIGLTAYLCLGSGWGQAAGRIGASLAAVMVLAHSQDVLEYSALRVIDTMIGIVAGLCVSYFVLPVRGRDLMARNTRRALDAVSDMLTVLSRPGAVPARDQYVRVFDAMVALDKTLTDAKKELGGEFETLRDEARHVALACVGALSAAIAHAELVAHPAERPQEAALRDWARTLAQRAQAAASAGGDRRHPRAHDVEDAAQEALHGIALAYREIDHALHGLGR